MRLPLKTVIALAAAAPLAACISFGAKPPPSLLTLQSASVVPAGQTQSSASNGSVTIQVPVVGQALATTRVPVQENETAIAYVKDAQWVEPPARLFARLLSDNISARTGRVVLSPAQSFSDPGARLSGELRSFGVDAGGSQAVVAFDAALIRKDSNVVEKRRFEARAPLSAVDAANVGPAINQAANQVATELADWIGK